MSRREDEEKYFRYVKMVIEDLDSREDLLDFVGTPNDQLTDAVDRIQMRLAIDRSPEPLCMRRIIGENQRGTSRHIFVSGDAQVFQVTLNGERLRSITEVSSDNVADVFGRYDEDTVYARTLLIALLDQIVGVDADLQD